MKNKKTWITIIVLVLLLGGCFGELVISDVIFKYHCKKNIEFSVYETVELNDKYIIDIPKDVRKRDSRFNISESKMLDNRKLIKEYEISFYESNKISNFGPVQSRVTSVVRKSDGRLMGKVISFRKLMGWINNLSGDAPVDKHCSYGNRISDSLDYDFHDSLITKLFLLN
jgi:hypothetical protein